jgi:uncharacterized membrane protein HdeD (DUF308 family)
MPVKSLIRALVLRGVIAIVFGIVAIVWPEVTAIALAILFGFYAIIDGIGELMAAFRRDSDRWHRVALALAGVAGIAVGVVALIWPEITAAALAILVGIWAIVTGVADIWAAIRFRREMRQEWLLALVGILSIVAGILIVLQPDAGAVTIAVLIGAFAFVAGVLMLVAARRMHKLSQNVRTASGSTA